MILPIYLDYAATTPVDPRVAEKMARHLTLDGLFGNASSSHAFGQAAKQAIETARAQVAQLLHADPSEIIWTSGATESNNLALKGAVALYQRKGKHIITLKTEHQAVLDPCQQLEKIGFRVTYLSPQPNGLLDLNQFQAALCDDTILVSIMHVNNELGVIQDIPAISQITRSRDILLHVDAAQSIGKMPFDVTEMPVDLVSFSAHKLYGPKGIGVLYVRKKPRVRVAAQIHGGGQENGMRSGTLATHQIVGMGEACELARQEMSVEANRIRALRALFLNQLNLLDISMNGAQEYTLPNILNLRFNNISAKSLMNALPNLAISMGSACLGKDTEPSYVLRALGQSREQAASALRFSFGRFTTEAEILSSTEQLIQAVKTLR